MQVNAYFLIYSYSVHVFKSHLDPKRTMTIEAEWLKITPYEEYTMIFKNNLLECKGGDESLSKVCAQIDTKTAKNCYVKLKTTDSMMDSYEAYGTSIQISNTTLL